MIYGLRKTGGPFSLILWLPKTRYYFQDPDSPERLNLNSHRFYQWAMDKIVCQIPNGV